MPKQTVLYGFIMAVAAGLLLFMSPGMMSLAFVLAMIAIAAVAFIFGVYRVDRCNQAFLRAAQEVKRIQGVQTQDPWLAVRQLPQLFGYEAVDRVFDRYRRDVDDARSQEKDLTPDLEDYVNEDAVGLLSWRGVILQIPGVLTGVGILGTFIGLIIGVGGVGFSSVTAAINGVETLLNGIEIAFYTSIAGLVLSILFNLAYRMVWNVMNRNLQKFILDFQAVVIPSTPVQELQCSQEYRRQVLQALAAQQES